MFLFRGLDYCYPVRLFGPTRLIFPGRGMNAAFAVGRLSDLAKGRNLLLSMPEGNKMISQLGECMSSLLLTSTQFVSLVAALSD